MCLVVRCPVCTILGLCAVRLVALGNVRCIVVVCIGLVAVVCVGLAALVRMLLTVGLCAVACVSGVGVDVGGLSVSTAVTPLCTCTHFLIPLIGVACVGATTRVKSVRLCRWQWAHGDCASDATKTCLSCGRWALWD